MPDYNPFQSTDQLLPKQELQGTITPEIAQDIATKQLSKPTTPIVEKVNNAVKYVQEQKNQAAAIKLLADEKAKEVKAQRENKINSLTEKYFDQYRMNPSYPNQDEIRNGIKSQIEQQFKDNDNAKEQEFEHYVNNIPNESFGIKTPEIQEKLSSFRNKAFESADISRAASPLNGMSDLMRIPSVLYEQAQNIKNRFDDNAAKAHYYKEVRNQYPNANDAFVKQEGDKRIQQFIIHQAKKENPDDFKGEGFTQYFDENGEPTLQFKKDVYNIAGGDPKKLKDAAAQLIDYESGNFGAAKSRNEENWQRLQNNLANKLGGIPYILQQAVSGVSSVIDPEIEAAHGISSLLRGEGYSKGAMTAKKQLENEPAYITPENLSWQKREAAGLAHGVTNLTARMMMFGGVPSQIASKAAEAGMGKATPYIEQLLKNKTTTQIAQLTDHALDVSKAFFVPTFTDNMVRYREMGYDESEAFAKSMAVTVPSMYMYAAMGMEGDKAKEMLGNLLSPEKKVILDNLKIISKGVGTGMLAGAGQSVYQNFIDSKNGNFDLGKAVEQSVEPAIQWGMFDLAMKGLHPQQLLSKSPQSDAIAYAMRNRDAFQKEVENAVVSKRISSQEGLDILKSLNNIEPSFHEGISLKLSEKAAAQYATEKAKYRLLNDAVNVLKSNPNADPIKLKDAEVRRAETAKNITQIKEGTYLKGKVISGEEMAKIAAKTNSNKVDKQVIKDNAPYANLKTEIKHFLQDEQVQQNIRTLRNRESLQTRVDEYNQLQEENDIINHAHKEIKGVKTKTEPSEKEAETLSKNRGKMKKINDSLAPSGGIKSVRDMLSYNHENNSGHILVGRDGNVIEGHKELAYLAENGFKRADMVTSIPKGSLKNILDMDAPEHIKKEIVENNPELKPEPTKSEVVETPPITTENETNDATLPQEPTESQDVTLQEATPEPQPESEVVISREDSGAEYLDKMKGYEEKAIKRMIDDDITLDGLLSIMALENPNKYIKDCK